MPINFKYNCNECEHRFSNEEPVYCQKCYDNLQKKIADLESLVDELTEEKDSLREKVDMYEQDL